MSYDTVARSRLAQFRGYSSGVPWFVLALAAATFFISMWLVVPPPTMALLQLAVGGPEIGPLLLPPALFVGFLAWRVRGRPRPLSLALSAIAVVLFAIPMTQYPRDVPFSITTLLAGVDMGFRDASLE